MALTYIKTKDGKEYCGTIHYWRPIFNWFSIFGAGKKRFTFDECESVITKGERVSISSPPEGEDCDEMVRAKKDLDDGRKYGWSEKDENGVQEPYPLEKFDWEKDYESDKS